MCELMSENKKICEEGRVRDGAHDACRHSRR